VLHIAALEAPANTRADRSLSVSSYSVPHEHDQVVRARRIAGSSAIGDREFGGRRTGGPAPTTALVVAAARRRRVVVLLSPGGDLERRDRRPPDSMPGHAPENRRSAGRQHPKDQPARRGCQSGCDPRVTNRLCEPSSDIVHAPSTNSGFLAAKTVTAASRRKGAPASARYSRR
jgi:hypothetical protein